MRTMTTETQNSARRAHPSTSEQVETMLAARHIEYSFEPNLRIDAISDVEGNQVRLSEHRAPKAMVSRYAEQMRAGAVFPAIVVNDRRELVDGNTRRMAAMKNGLETIPAYICSDLSALQARSLSVELNQSHGLSMTEEEIRAFVDSAIAEGQMLDTKSYARMSGTRASTLARWVAAKQFEMRAEREGVPPDVVAGLSDSARAVLNTTRLKSVFREAAALAAAARVPVSQLKAIVSEANGAGSEEEALAVVTSARAARADDIRVIAAGFRARKLRSAGSALHIGELLRFEVEDLLDVAPEKQIETFARLSALHQRLEAVVRQARATWNLSDQSLSESLDLAQVV